MDINLHLKLDEHQSHKLVDMLNAINAHRPDSDHVTANGALGKLLYGILDTLHERGHNTIVGIETTHRDIQAIREKQK